MIPDPAASRAVLVGTSRYQSAALPDLPAVSNNLAALNNLLRSPQWWGLPPENCVVVPDPATTSDMIDPIVHAVHEATDTLLLYYSGHGLPDPRRGDLHFALTGTDPGRMYTAVRYDQIRDELLDSRAIRCVIILDCCYSGRALGALADPATAVINEMSVDGTYIMAAAPENKIALSPPGEPYTAFTAELLDILSRGVPGIGEYLSLDTIYNHVLGAMRDKGRPLPQKRDRNTAGQLTLVRNRAYASARTAATSGTATAPRRPQPPPGAFDAPGQGLAVGIDLGTANAVVAIIEQGTPTVIANSEGSRTTPSVVAIAKNGEILVGETAKRQAVTNIDRTIRSVKREIGTDWKTTIDGTSYTAQEISAFVLQKLKRDAQAYLGERVTDAVITVPAHFSDAQREATVDAGRIAGLNVLRVINEQVCAVLAYGIDRLDGTSVSLIWHLGGTSFDVSLLEVGDGVIEVKATSGDNHLGGDDWDQRIIDWLVTKFRNEHGIDLSKDKMAMQRLREAAEKAKIELSSTTRISINLPYITANAEGPLHLEEDLSRTQFQDMTRDLLDRTSDILFQALQDVGRYISHIDYVILTGGASDMPAVRDLVASTIQKKVLVSVKPAEVNAVGACIHAAALKGR